jgi:hypothetical protein
MQRERDRQITQYFSEVRGKPLLSRQQEIADAEQIDTGKRARRQIASGSLAIPIPELSVCSCGFLAHLI